MSARLDFSQHQRSWPNADRSEFVRSSEIVWHIQRWSRDSAQTAPTIVLLHGTGASAHSWSTMAPLLARHFNIVSLDLPGHGFTHLPPDEKMSITGMARLVKQLLADLLIPSSIFIGHSAGSAIAIEAVQLGAVCNGIFSINGALLPFGSYNMPGMSSFSKVLSKSKLIPKIFSLQARYIPLVDHLLDSTGSSIPSASKQCYQILVSNEQHARAALIMMAQWNLIEFAKSLPTALNNGLASNRLVLIACSSDQTVSPRISDQVNGLIPGSQLIRVPALGHLGHEENPELFAQLILAKLAATI